jgi:HipA-like kinase
MPIRARRLIRKMRGGAQSHLIEGDDGNLYVVKFTNNPQHRRILVNEWLSSGWLKYLQIHSPEASVIELSDKFISANPELSIVRGSKKEPPFSGLHFGSRMSVNPNRVAIYDFLPDALLAKVENRCDFLGILVFDKWVCNADSRQSIFFRARAKSWTPLKGDKPVKIGFFAQMIDHGFAFNGPHWQYPDSPMQGVYFRSNVYEEVTGLDSFQPWLGMVRHFPVEVIEQAWKAIPPDWLDGDDDQLEQLLEKLLKRRSRVEELLQDLAKRQPSIFPNWH